MWTKSVCVLMVVVAVTLLTSDPAEGWRIRFRGRRLWQKVKPVAVKHAVHAVVTGKRSVEEAGAEEDGPSEDELKQLAEDLDDACSKLPDDPKAVGLTSTAMDTHFKQADVNGDNTLKGNELEQFAEVIDTYESCAELERK
ncbi:uncharacterized protein LOC143274873 [Babylonia areolata]|uniref:uncharacterized protein LOC143274873 n=1 Tax=Babylonia areolata TaxID=304850 RepID=UPI003FD6055B